MAHESNQKKEAAHSMTRISPLPIYKHSHPDTFDEHLSNFITECRNEVLAELKKTDRYTEWKLKTDDLLAEVLAHLPPDSKEIFEEYGEALNAIAALENNTYVLFGMTLQEKLLRRFDRDAPEHKALATHFV